MDSITLSKERITLEIKSAVRNINRNLYEWKEGTKNSNFTISYTEIFSVTKNWLVRKLRESLGSRVADSIFKRGNLSVSIDGDNTAIRSIGINTTDTLEKPTAILLDTILRDMDFSELRYDPKDYEHGEFTGFEPLFVVDLTKLQSFKF